MDKYEEARRGSLYLGAGILGSIIGNVLYAFWFSTTLGIGSATVSPPFLSFALLVGASVFYLAFQAMARTVRLDCLRCLPNDRCLRENRQHRDQPTAEFVFVDCLRGLMAGRRPAADGA
jgi:hypothetical protein